MKKEFGTCYKMGEGGCPTELLFSHSRSFEPLDLLLNIFDCSVLSFTQIEH